MAKFVVFEKVNEAAYRYVDKSQASSGTQTAVNLGSGLIAGFAAAIVSQPADTMLSKINKTKGLPGEGTTSRLVKIAKELGLRGSYTGIGARLFMVGTLTAGQFSLYGSIKKVSDPVFCFVPSASAQLIHDRHSAQPAASNWQSKRNRVDQGDAWDVEKYRGHRGRGACEQVEQDPRDLGIGR